MAELANHIVTGLIPMAHAAKVRRSVDFYRLLGMGVNVRGCPGVPVRIAPAHVRSFRETPNRKPIEHVEVLGCLNHKCSCDG